MNELVLGSLFTGYGGLDIAVRAALAAFEIRTRVAWHADTKPASIALLRHRYPEVPNFGDIRFLHTGRHERIDVLAASWPCQPHSSAGLRLGEADPRALWPYVAAHIAHARPAIFFGENVARIASNGELRRVVRSLADLGYVGAWRVLRASDPPVYGCHQRARCFVVAVDPAADAVRVGLRHEPGRRSGPDGAGQGVAQHDGAPGSTGLTLLPTPTTRNARGADQRGQRADGGGCGPDLQTVAVQLLPTPKASDGRHGGPSMRTSSGAATLPAEAVKLLPTPTVTDSRGGRNATAERSPGKSANPGTTLSDVAYGESWGQYAEAVARWAHMLGRPASDPTQISLRTGGPQLAAPFVEWMMGLPTGWVCAVPALARRADGHRNAALSLLGDGVVPQQGQAAFEFLLSHLAARLAAERAA